MTSFEELLSIDKKSAVPVYLQITNAFIHNIRRGQIKRGFKLPGSRELAGILNIHRNTLQAAYNELMAQGWIEIVPRKGTFVVQDLPEIKPQIILYSKNDNAYPDKTAFPINEKKLILFPQSAAYDPQKIVIDDGLPDTQIAPVDILMKEYKSISVLKAFKKYFRYGNANGTAYLLEILAEYLKKTRGLHITEKNILITRGAQMGMYVTAKLLLNEGDNVIVGEPGYFAANLTFQFAGALIHRVPVDDFGIDVDAVERLCGKKKIKLIYIVPHHHYPTTVTLIPERRVRLLELAHKYKFAIVEDDYDYDFHYNNSPVLPMVSLDHRGNVIYIGTLTKTFVPSIRIGFVIAPENFISSASHIRRAVDWQGDSMMEAAMAQLFQNGTIERHIKKAVKLYRERRDNFCSLLKNKIGEQISFKIPDGGMAVWAKFNNVDVNEVTERALRKGLMIGNGSLFNTGKINYNSTRLGFASLNSNVQSKAIELLQSCF